MRAGEALSKVEQGVCAMPFLWLAIDDGPGAESLRGHIERNAIALLSSFEKELSIRQYRLAGHSAIESWCASRAFEPEPCR